MVGTRGVPARYGGFETAVEEIGQRLVARGHEVTVYCRGSRDKDLKTYLGMHLVHLPAVRKKSLETLSHSALSLGHAVLRGPRPDVVLLFNSANAPLIPLLRTRGIPAAVHVDGLEWNRSKWSGLGRHYYRNAESLAVRWADGLIADAQGIADYYLAEFGARTEVIAYGAPILEDDPAAPHTSLADHGLRRHDYHLAVARFEPENHVLEILRGFAASKSKLDLVVVGSNPYGGAYSDALNEIAQREPRIHMLGGVWDQDFLNSLYANALTYLHGHSVGGTNPSLLRAMGAGAPVIAKDVVFNREVLGPAGRFFDSEASVAAAVSAAERDLEETIEAGQRLRARAEELYDWELVTDGYADLARRLVAGESNRQLGGRRRGVDMRPFTGARPDLSQRAESGRSHVDRQHA